MIGQISTSIVTFRLYNFVEIPMETDCSCPVDLVAGAEKRSHLRG